ncbi:uncharacterized protein LOC129760657 [Uranotaenia lowii]|uniref:uncharacterized protein LOC129760657 n=1 Tax=Uranotaenia lowii TaxID=190385 RepID=UPI002479EE72|nr:uncharacterized protein LOC129760657 [Uranotaenia lowii]
MVKKVRSTPAPKDDRFDSLVHFGLVVQNMCSHLQAVGLAQHLSDPTLLNELVEKLPPTVKFNWGLYLEQIPCPDLSVFAQYMERVVKAASRVTLNNGTTSRISKDERSRKEKGFINTHSITLETPEDTTEVDDYPTNTSNVKNAVVCVACNDTNHHITNCSVFKEFTLDDRWNLVKRDKLCRNCLSQHRRWPCRGRTCVINNCQKRHHRLLHFEPQVNQSTASVNVHREISSSTLFRMLPVLLIGPKAKVETYAFLDDGSSVTLLERAIADKIGAEGPSTSLCIQWTGGVNKTISDTKILELQISGIDAEKCLPVSEVYTVDSLGLPEQNLDFNKLKNRFEHLDGIPVKSFKSAVPGILIGLSNAHLLTTFKKREGRVNEPIASKTRIGWSVYGRLPGGASQQPHRQMHICGQPHHDDLHELVKGFFDIDSLGIALAPTVQSFDDERAYRILRETTRRTTSGRFEVGLLWRFDYIELPDSKPMAEKRLKCLETRLKKNPDLYDKVRQQIKDYQLKGYAHKATKEELEKFDLRRTWFCPLGVVINERKPGKIRLIWDAAARVEGVSLNSVLMKGPDLISSLLSILFQYRERKVAISADIKEMFHQILIREQDRSAQLFLWRDSPEHPLDIMVTDVAIFGATCSPVQSQFVKNLNATEYSSRFPKACNDIMHLHYMDDYLRSADTVDEAIELALQVTKVHEKGGFQIVNWLSNESMVLDAIGQADPTAVKNLQLDKTNRAERLLGILWHPKEDVFTFSLNLREDVAKILVDDKIPTKRELLKVVMSIYDPLGLISLFVVQGKIIVQDVWRSKIDWDEEISTEMTARWKLWLNTLQQIKEFQIPRCYFPNYNEKSYDNLQLHIFTDASEQACAAVAYFRIVEKGNVRCALVTSKTKVAPLQFLSIPRLELLAAVLGVRLKKIVEQEHTLVIKRTVLWSDSTTVLAWIRSDTRRYTQYVGHRVNEILHSSQIQQWRWVPTSLNVADEATKWGKGLSIQPDSRWLKAPEFLYDNEEEWPHDHPISAQETNEELRPAMICVHVAVEPLIDVTRFSKWERLLRCVGYVFLFIEKRLRKPGEVTAVRLSREHLRRAENVLWRMAQHGPFFDELSILKHNSKLNCTTKRKLQKSSPLVHVNPFIDENDVIRMSGRLEAAEWLSYDARNPVILPRDSRITYLILDWYHRQHRHANNETVVNEVRQRFYVARLRVQIQTLSRKTCMWCKVYKARPVAPQMAPLPKVRVTPNVRPFSFTGIDYFGPYYIKIGRAVAKRWVVLFTCLTVRAIHLEIAASLSTDSCKKAIRRFIARRGAPEEIYTDHGTNFKGASRELKAELSKLNGELGTSFTDAVTQWYFNPPAAPHMGGCWERMVRSVKTALETIPIADKLDEESLATVLAEAEHMINSRPLTFIPLRSTEEESLTPNHFLMLSSKGVHQGTKITNPGNSLRTSWEYIQRVLQEFWRRWVVAYLPTIARRTKWFDDIRPIQNGELVIIVDERIRNRWLRGRVLKTYPGKDGVTRRADVQTADGIFSRPVTKLALLDVGTEHDAEPEILAT